MALGALFRPRPRRQQTPRPERTTQISIIASRRGFGRDIVGNGAPLRSSRPRSFSAGGQGRLRQLRQKIEQVRQQVV